MVRHLIGNSAARERAGSYRRPSNRSSSAASTRWRAACPSSDARGFRHRAQGALRLHFAGRSAARAAGAGVALGSAPEPYMIAAAVRSGRPAGPQQVLPHRRRHYPGADGLPCAANLRVHPKLRARNAVERVDPDGAVLCFHRRHSDDRRHRLLDAVRDAPLLRLRRALALLLRHGLGSALLGGRQLRRRVRPVRPDPAAVGHALHLARRPAGRRAGRAVRRHLHVRIRQPPRAHGGQAGAGNPRRHPDHRLRHLRAGHLRAVPARCAAATSTSTFRRAAC